MDKKYQIFISSTYEDLKDARRKVQDAILSMYHFPVGMEFFGAADSDQWEVIKDTIDSSDYYILIIAHRYGSIITEGPDAGISYTKKEFNYAKEKGIPILAFIIDDEANVKGGSFETDSKKKNKLREFKNEVKNGRVVVWWKNEDDLATKVTASLYNEFKRKKRPGWVRGDSIDLEKDLMEIITLNHRIRELENENKELRSLMNERKPILSIVFNDGDKWRLPYKEIKLPDYFLTNYQPLSVDDIPDAYKDEITLDQINEYNVNLPSQEILNKYANEVLIYRYKKEASINFDFSVENNGSCKAKDINITIEFPKELLVCEKEEIRNLSCPKAPKRPRNPLEKLIESPLVSLKRELYDSFKDISLPNLQMTGNINYNQEIEDNCVFIEIRALLHTYTVDYKDFCVVPLKKGNYEIKCSIMCEEFIKPVEQIVEVIVN